MVDDRLHRATRWGSASDGEDRYGSGRELELDASGALRLPAFLLLVNIMLGS